MIRRILVVDDEELSRNILIRFLEKNHYEAMAAANGQEALSVLKADPNFSAILLDLIMPVMDGYELLEILRADDRLSSIPVLVQTVDRDSEKRALSLGANDYIVKPFDQEVLLRRLENTIELKEKSSIINATRRDALTGLYSRTAFLEKMGKLVEAHSDGYYVLTCFDIDRFKVINDLYGTMKGDEVLRTIAGRLEDYFTRADGICCRVNADNFAVLYPYTLMDSDEVEEVIRKARMHNGFLSNITFSAGRYIINDKTLSPSAMYDRAMIAKATIKGRYDLHTAIYEEGMRKRILSEQEIVSEMNIALTTGQFEVWYQPQYNHETGSLIGAEALVRWRHPEKGLIGPGVFIPIFEQNGFVYEIDKFVWEQCCKFLRQLLDKGEKIVPIAVNISRYDIFQPGLCDLITGLIRKYDLKPELLRLEITESAFAKSSLQIIAVVEALKKEGFIVEIDDFGSGYSSLNTLKDVPADVLKLDMKFLEEGVNSDKGGNIVASVVRMARWIGMSVIAEGVETIQEANFLKSIGCFYIQGYLYSRPLPETEYISKLRENEHEETMLSLEKVETYDVEAFWNPASIETLMFNSFVGGACIFEYHAGQVTLLRVNDKYVKIMGRGMLTESQILDYNLVEYISREDALNSRRVIEKAIATMEEITDEIAFRDFRGSDGLIYVRALIRVIAKTEERYLFYCLIEDITEQRIAEQQIKAAEQKEMETAQRLQVIMGNIRGGVSAISIHDDGTSRMLFCNDRYYDLYGYSAGQAQEENLDVMSLILPEDMPKVMDSVHEMKRNKRATVIDYRCRKRDGEIVYLRANSALMRMDDEDVITSVVTDITEQKLLSDQMEAIVSNINGGLIVTSFLNGSPEVILVNDRFYEILGYTREQYMDECNNRYEQIYAKDRERVVRKFEDTASTAGKYTMEYRIVRRDGVIRWIQNNFSVMKIFGIEEPVQLAIVNDITEKKEIEENLRQKEEEYRLATQHSGRTIARYHIADRRLTITSETANRLSMPEVIEDVPQGRIKAGTISPDTVETYTAFYESIFRGEAEGTAMFQMLLPNGWRWLNAHFTTIFSEQGIPVSALISFVDITEQCEKEAIYQKWQQSLHNRPGESYTLFRCDLSQNTSFDSKEGSLIHFGYLRSEMTFDEFTEKYAAENVHEDDREEYIASIRMDKLIADYYRGQRTSTMDYRETGDEGVTRWLRRSVDLIQRPDSTGIMAYLMFENIDESKRIELKNRTLAETDPLTGLYNRKVFANKLERAIKKNMGKSLCALFLIDMDGFKMVNDTFGHAMGDQVLMDTSRGICSVLRDYDIVGRLGGDEFLVGLCNVPDKDIIRKKARQILKLTHKAFNMDVQMSASIGIAVYPDDGREFDILYQKADKALYQIKENGKDNFAFYCEKATDLVTEKIESEADDFMLEGANSKRRLLVIDDKADDLNLMSILGDEFQIDFIRDSNGALNYLRRYGDGVSMVLLNLEMSGLDGFMILNKIQHDKELQSIPVIVINKVEDHKTNLLAIRCGACDFIAVPIDAELLRFRIQTAISKAENQHLRAKNRYLTLLSNELEKYRSILKDNGTVIIEYNKKTKEFLYDGSIGQFLPGNYDDRSLWDIWEEAGVAGARDVEALQNLLTEVCEKNIGKSKEITIQLLTNAGDYHDFRVRVMKGIDELQPEQKLFLVMTDKS